MPGGEEALLESWDDLTLGRMTTGRSGRGCRVSGQRPGELALGGIQGRCASAKLGSFYRVTIMVAMQCAGAEASFRDGRLWTIDDAAVGQRSQHTRRLCGNHRPAEQTM